MSEIAPGPTYFDLHQALYRSHFERGLEYEDYLATGKDAHRARWRNYEGAAVLDEAQRTLLGGFTRRMNLLCLSGVWCGDCARLGPVLRAVAAASPPLVLRFLDRDANPELRDLLRIAGAGRVPNTVVLSEDFFLVDRLGDRMLATYRRMAAEKLGPA